MRRLLFFALLSFALLSHAILPGDFAAAQTSPFQGTALESEGAERTEAWPWQSFQIWVRDAQHSYQQEMAASLRDLKGERPLAAAFALSFLAFLYGVVHALGPGHGKTVMVAYMLTNEAILKRGLIISAAASLMQAVTAVVLVYGLLWLIDTSARAISSTAHWLEIGSFLLIAGVGCYLVRRGWSALRAALANQTPAHGHAHHAHDHNCDHGHAHGHAHGHVHLPGPADIERAQGWRAAAGLIVAVGLRPCSGALLVLIFSYSLGLHLAGVAASFAMAVGTGGTVMALALLAFLLKQPLRLFSTKRGGLWFGRVVGLIAMLGGAAIALFGGALAFATWSAPPALGF